MSTPAVKRAVSFVVGNGLFAFVLYATIVYEVTVTYYTLAAMVLLCFVSAILLALIVSRQKVQEALFTQIIIQGFGTWLTFRMLNKLFDIAVTITLMYFGFYVLGVLYLIHYLCIEYTNNYLLNILKEGSAKFNSETE